MDLYKLLGIKDTASKDEIKKAYRKLALRSHPDKNQSSDAAEQFRAVNEAYKILKDDHRRELYDRSKLPTPRASRVRSHDDSHRIDLDRIRQVNSRLLDATNEKRCASSAPTTTRSSGMFVGEILPDVSDDEYEKIVLQRLRALG